MRVSRSTEVEEPMRQFQDRANWDGVHFESVNVGAKQKTKKHIFSGYHYCTKGEVQLAELLTTFGVGFTPDVPFALEMPDGRVGRFVPDFVFNRKAYIWNGRNRPMLIHGIEAKGRTKNGEFSTRALENVRLLEEQRGIRVLLLSNSQIKQYFNLRRLPLKLFEPTE